MLTHYREPIHGPHTPAIPLPTSDLLAAYFDGINDASAAKVYEPPRNGTRDQRAAYRAGYDKAREQPRRALKRRKGFQL